MLGWTSSPKSFCCEFCCSTMSSFNVEMRHLSFYLVVHDGSQAHDTHVHIIFLTDESWVLQSPSTRQSVWSGHQSGTTQTDWIRWNQSRWKWITIKSYISHLMECRAARGTDDDGEGRLQSPCRSSMERLQGESMDASSPPDSVCSPSNLDTQVMTFTPV